jgi:hypothetical protein
VILFLGFAAVGHTGAMLDRKAQLLEAPGVAAADLRAPSASIARVKAERAAKKQAEAKLRAALEELGAKKSADKVIEGASVVDERFGSDGSVELKLRASTDGVELKKHRDAKE